MPCVRRVRRIRALGLEARNGCSQKWLSPGTLYGLRRECTHTTRGKTPATFVGRHASAPCTSPLLIRPDASWARQDRRLALALGAGDLGVRRVLGGGGAHILGALLASPRALTTGGKASASIAPTVGSTVIFSEGYGRVGRGGLNLMNPHRTTRSPVCSWSEAASELQPRRARKWRAAHARGAHAAHFNCTF